MSYYGFRLAIQMHGYINFFIFALFSIRFRSIQYKQLKLKHSRLFSILQCIFFLNSLRYATTVVYVAYILNYAIT